MNRPSQKFPESRKAVQDFNDAVCAEMESSGVDRQRAIAVVAKRDPELHRAFLAAHNSHFVGL